MCTLTRFQHVTKIRQDPNVKRVLLVETWGGIGDCWLATPALKALKSHNPDLDLRVRCLENHIEILRRNPWIDFVSFRPEDPHFHDVEALDTNYAKLRPSTNGHKPATEIIADLRCDSHF